MERHVKERLIGAAVLMAAAIILIPEMLSGPKRHEGEPVRRIADETAVKTYTIDLNRPPGSAQEPVIAEVSPAPPPETARPITAEPLASNAPISSNTTETNPESGGNATASESTRPPSADSSQTPTEAAKPPRATAQQTPPTSPPENAPRAVASEASVPISRGWAVQLGSFSSRASADRLASEFRADGYKVFVMPVETRKATLYRVRIGPIADRAEADAMLRRARTKVSGAAVVAHP